MGTDISTDGEITLFKANNQVMFTLFQGNNINL